MDTLKTSKIQLVIRDQTRSRWFKKKIFYRYLDCALGSIDREILHSHSKGFDFEVGIVFCGKVAMTKLNAQCRKKNKNTDVLSFPLQDFTPQNKYSSKRWNMAYGHLGDIVLNKEKAITQALEAEHSVEKELLNLFIHGFLHLLGYDHEHSRKEEELMFRWQDNLLSLIEKRIGAKNAK